MDLDIIRHQVGAGCAFQQGWGAHRADHSHPSSADVKNEWRCTSPASLCLRGHHGVNFTFLTPSGEWSILHGMDRCTLYSNYYVRHIIVVTKDSQRKILVGNVHAFRRRSHKRPENYVSGCILTRQSGTPGTWTRVWEWKYIAMYTCSVDGYLRYYGSAYGHQSCSERGDE
jgi:hypothetical protein